MNRFLMHHKTAAQNIPLPAFIEDSEAEPDATGYESTLIFYTKYNDIKSRFFERDIDTLLVCLENPRNEIDNPIRYCTLHFQTAISTFFAATAVRTLPHEYQLHSSLWFIRQAIESISRIEATLNISPGGWGWFQFGETRTADYFVSAYMKNKISAELAIRLSGLSEINFAQMVQERAMRRDQLVFHEYLRGEDVDKLLPFSEEKSSEFRGIMANEIE